jgi:hypothetical protein
VSDPSAGFGFHLLVGQTSHAIALRRRIPAPAPLFLLTLPWPLRLPKSPIMRAAERRFSQCTKAMANKAQPACTVRPSRSNSSPIVLAAGHSACDPLARCRDLIAMHAPHARRGRVFGLAQNTRSKPHQRPIDMSEAAHGRLGCPVGLGAQNRPSPGLHNHSRSHGSRAA